MTERKKDLMRIQSLIENDRLSTGDNFEELIRSDIHKLLQDYFEYRGLPSVVLEKENGKLRFFVELTPSAIKPFGIVPKK